MMPEGVELRMRVPEIPVVVAVDPYRLKQVLSILSICHQVHDFGI